MPDLIHMLLNVIKHLAPMGSVAMFPFLAMMLLSLGSTMVIIHKMLRRKNLGESLISLAIPYVLFGTLFIIEPLLTSSLFGDPRIIEKSGAFEMLTNSSRIYVEMLLFVGLFALYSYLFAEAASRCVTNYHDKTNLHIAAFYRREPVSATTVTL